MCSDAAPDDRLVASVRRLRQHEWRAYRDVRLRALAESPDAFGSLWELEREKPDGHWRERVGAGATSDADLPLVVETEGQTGFGGLAWGRVDPSDPETAYVFQMWVAPELRGQGIGRALLAEIVRWARASDVRRLKLGVTRGNVAAEKLYHDAGFRAAGEAAPLRPGSTLVSRTLSLEL